MFTHPQRQAIRQAIRDAEAGTTGRVAVRIVPETDVDACERAKAEFEKAGLHRHDQRNAALILVAPRARQYAVIGDEALQERVAASFWDDVVAKMKPFFVSGDMAGGVVLAINSIGEELHAHFAQGKAR